MSVNVSQAIDIFNKLNKSAQIRLLEFAMFLESEEKGDDYLPYDYDEMIEDIELYDNAMANDDGYRISTNELKKEYGI